MVSDTTPDTSHGIERGRVVSDTTLRDGYSMGCQAPAASFHCIHADSSGSHWM